MIRTLIFDWDGTLHNTERLYGNAFRKAYHWLVVQDLAPEREYTDQEVSQYLGMNAPDMWNCFMPQLPQPVKERASAMIGQGMVAEIQAGHAILYPGTAEVLTKLNVQGYEMVILSNCKRDYLEANRRAFGLDRWFQGFYCCQDFDFAPKEEIFPTIFENHPRDFAVIGDRASDFRVAKIHQLSCVGCAYGFGTAQELSQADLIAHRVEELPELIQKLQHGA
jgi:phosphoglycolate phosphatase